MDDVLILSVVVVTEAKARYWIRFWDLILTLQNRSMKSELKTWK
jgi:hypothetical protein